MGLQEYNLKQTSKSTSSFDDVILEKRKSKGLRSRQILSAQIIDNLVDSNDSLNICLIHQKAKTGGGFDENYIDLRKIEPGSSFSIRLDTLQTKQLYDKLKEYYPLSKGGVSNGKKFVVSGVEDANQIIIESNKGKVELIKKVLSNLSDDQFSSLLLESDNINNLFSALPRIRIDILESLKKEVESKLLDNEKAIQKWIDEEPKTRCLIFGLEFIDYKREVQFGSSRFDILTEQSGSEHVIIEMKSPNVDVFEEKTTQLKNGTKREFIISKDLAEAIPQTIKYFREYEGGNEETFQKIGADKKKPHKALIIIGRRKEDPIWQQHYSDLNNRISGIEILTYDHLIEKMTNQIKNLKELKELK